MIKKNYIILSLLGIGLLVSCNTNSEDERIAEIEFEDIIYDYGNIELNEEGICSFQFENVGRAPLLIERVETVCSCIVINWTKEPVKSGRSGEIQLEYDTSNPGYFMKWAVVHYNGQDSPVILTIKGQVLSELDADKSQ